jgi:cbb3-type cytochrome oxidase subunit 1
MLDNIFLNFAERWFGDNVGFFLVSAFMAAAVLFAIRKYLRPVYGFIEILAGLSLL